MSSDAHDAEFLHSKTDSGRWHHALHPDVLRSDSHSAVRFGSFVHPTHTRLALSTERNLAWTSRDHRKHRHLFADPSGRPRHRSGALQKLANMTRMEYWNLSWWVAILFTVGSTVWCINGFLSFLPFVNTNVAENDVGIGWTVWIGATIFEFGGLAALLEGWNRDDAADFGWNVKSLLHGNGASSTSSPGEPEKSSRPPKRKWIWFSTDMKYFHEIGFLAVFVQYLAATTFWISGFTAIPAIQNAIAPHTGLLDAIFWTPQVIGGCGFIIASALMMLETQRKWYIPEPTSLGWHVGLWNLIGGVGFALCGAFGYGLNRSTKIAYQSSCSTFWGSFSFLIGSVIQWYECVNPVEGDAED